MAVNDPSLADFHACASLQMRTLVTVVLAAVCGVANGGCAYRFTNSYVTRPAGIHSIAVEAIYDTSREVVPHEILWESLQNALAADGHLVLVPQGQADALLRAHVRTAAVNAAGTNQILDANADLSQKSKDPNPFPHDVPPSPSDFLNLGKAANYQDQGQVNLVCDIEVVDLNTHAVLLKKTYTLAGLFQAVHSTGVPSSSVANDHLRYDEAMRADFKKLSASLADSVVTDLMAR